MLIMQHVHHKHLLIVKYCVLLNLVAYLSIYTNQRKLAK